MSSSPQPVPISNSAKSPSQEVNSLSNSFNSTCSSRWKRSSPDPNKMMLGKSPNVLDPNAKRNILSSTPSRRNSHMSERVGSPSLSGYPVSLKFASNLLKMRIKFFQGVRRGSLDGHNSPDRSNGFFPHDLDDIYEYKTDHQYFTHTGATANERYCISSDEKRNLLFRNNGMIHSLDDYQSKELLQKNRFDNSSFIRGLNSTISQSSVDSGHHTGSSANNSKEKLSHKSHHHHSIQEMIKHFGKKVHIWPRSRHDSINENEISNSRQSVCQTPELTQEPQGNFRSRSKSLDVQMSRKILDDCESTYKIYNRILKEGKKSVGLEIMFTTFKCKFDVPPKNFISHQHFRF